jgi:GTP-binding protein
VLLVNKWDLREGNEGAKANYKAELHRRLPFLPWASVLFGSALQAKTVTRIFPYIDRALESFAQRVPTGQLNRFFQGIIAAHPLPVGKRKPVKSAYITQVAMKPPTFVVFCRNPKDIGQPYLRYVENCIRKEFDFAGTPIRVFAKAK